MDLLKCITWRLKNILQTLKKVLKPILLHFQLPAEDSLHPKTWSLNSFSPSLRVDRWHFSSQRALWTFRATSYKLNSRCSLCRAPSKQNFVRNLTDFISQLFARTINPTISLPTALSDASTSCLWPVLMTIERMKLKREDCTMRFPRSTGPI